MAQNMTGIANQLVSAEGANGHNRPAAADPLRTFRRSAQWPRFKLPTPQTRVGICD